MLIEEDSCPCSDQTASAVALKGTFAGNMRGVGMSTITLSPVL